MKTRVFAVVVLTLFLVITLFAVPIRAPPRRIRIGIIAPMMFKQGIDMWQGAILARKDIGTFNVGGTLYGIRLVFSDEFQGMADGTAETGRLAMEYLVAYGCDFVIGGFRSESVFGAREVAMDYQTIFLVTGAATDSIIDCGYPGTCGACVRCNYERYKYVFRITPVNSSTLIKSLTGKWYTFQYGFISNVLAKLAAIYDPYSTYPQVKYAAVVEDLLWAREIKAILGNVSFHLYKGIPNVWPYNAFGLADMFLGSPNSEGSSTNPRAMWTVLNGSVPFTYPAIPAGYAKLVYLAAVSPTATDLDAVLSAIKASGARVVIPIISAEKAGRAFTTSWKKMGVNAIPVGINVDASDPNAWTMIGGAVEYQTVLSFSGTRTPIITAKSTAFWDAYVKKFGSSPTYGAFGVYTAMDILATALNRAGTLNNDDIIPELEKYDELTGTGLFKFTGPHPGPDFDPSVGGNQPYPYSAANPTLKGTLHDVHSLGYGATWTDGYVRPLMCQWQKGRLEVVWPQDQSYSIKWRLPPAMYPLWETDLSLDGGIGPSDMGILAAAWQTRPGDPMWCLDADMDSNGIINDVDLDRLAKDWCKYVTLPYVPP